MYFYDVHWIYLVPLWIGFWTLAATTTMVCIKYAWPNTSFSSAGAFIVYVLWPFALLAVGPAALYRRIFRRAVDPFNWN